MTLLERFIAKIEKQESGCWHWIGGRHTQGYGLIKVDGVMHGAHRISYNLFHGDIPQGNVVMHICDNPPCVNPEHLKAGTHHENTLDQIAKGRSPAIRGAIKTKGSSALTEDDVREIRRRLDKDTDTEIANDYRVTSTAIRSIRIGKSWGWLDANAV